METQDARREKNGEKRPETKKMGRQDATQKKWVTRCKTKKWGDKTPDRKKNGVTRRKTKKNGETRREMKKK